MLIAWYKLSLVWSSHSIGYMVQYYKEVPCIHCVYIIRCGGILPPVFSISTVYLMTLCNSVSLYMFFILNYAWIYVCIFIVII